MSYTRAVRYHRRQIILKKVRLYLYRLLVVVMLPVLWCNPYRPVVVQSLSVLAGDFLNVAVNYTGKTPRGIIDYALPVVAWNDQRSGSRSTPEAALSAFITAAGIDIKEPQNMLNAQIPLLAGVNRRNSQGVQPGEIKPAAGEKEKQALADIEKEDQDRVMADMKSPPLVAVYNTHTGETYALTDGVERLNGKRGGVVKVAAALQKQLQQKYGIGVIRSDVIHDAQYNQSYIESEKTVRRLLERYKELKLLLDIHRDAGRSRADSYVKINGQKVARIMIVVGSDARRPFPNWQQNLAMARKLTEKMDQLYPGLSLGIRVKEGRYNQQYHTGALLLEIGSVKNSTEEAVLAAELLADVVAAVLNE
ncbi:stage II sporulation protein P [Desulfohalotomaculum tongense]|uniref:stage II sporulation protein P n=1 Tax=Desulforadius tongensis TaxID=1216062 RepID=UPI00195C81D0|nr:stage II sporulation protein P [Desulforadius tongensis]MBM7855702.1 stage II sporulation protein P [Desulforadius tongensis]